MVYQDRIRNTYAQLPPSYRRIADFLLNNYRDAAFMTAAEIGKACHADTTSVVRFAQRLGYPGFPELIAEIREMVKRDLRAIYEPALEDKAPENTFRRSIVRDRTNLEQVLLNLDATVLERVVQILMEAPRVFVVGEASPHHLAAVFAMRLQGMGLHAVCLPGDTPGRIALAIHLKPNDALVAFGLTKNTRSVAVAVKVAREDGIQTIAIANSPANPLAAVAEHVLYAPSRAEGPVFSLTGATAVIQGLLQVLAVNIEDATAEWGVRAEYLSRRFYQIWDEPLISTRDIITDYNQPDEQRPDS